MREVPDELLGPKMKALGSDRRRAFAFLLGTSGVTPTEAARQAGYSDPGFEHATVRVAAHRLMQDERVLEAVEEVARIHFRSLAPVAIHAAKEILAQPKHPAHPRMIEIVLDRTGYGPKSEQKVTIEHTASAEFEALAARFAPELGVARAKLTGGNVIEGEVNGTTEEVPGRADETSGGVSDGGDAGGRPAGAS